MKYIALAVVAMLFILPLPGYCQFLDPNCGIITKSKIAVRVVNGTIAKYNSSPWMVFLKSTDGDFVCGGTLITNSSYRNCFICIYTFIL